MNIEIIKRIFEFVDAKGFTQEQFGQKLMLSRAAISAWKTGTIQPNGDRVIDILIAYPDIDANWLIRGKSITESMVNVMKGKNLTNQQGENLSVSDINIWKERYMMAQQLIKEKDEQIILLRSIHKLE